MHLLNLFQYFFKYIDDFTELCLGLIKIIGVDKIMCKSTTHRIKILTKNPILYNRDLVNF